MIWQAVAFFGPIAATVGIWGLGLFPGKKTNLNSFFIIMLGGMETADFSWLPIGVAAPLATGLALSALLSNTVLTERI